MSKLSTYSYDSYLKYMHKNILHETVIHVNIKDYKFVYSDHIYEMELGAMEEEILFT